MWWLISMSDISRVINFLFEKVDAKILTINWNPAEHQIEASFHETRATESFSREVSQLLSNFCRVVQPLLYSWFHSRKLDSWFLQKSYRCFICLLSSIIIEWMCLISVSECLLYISERFFWKLKKTNKFYQMWGLCLWTFVQLPHKTFMREGWEGWRWL